MAIRITDPAKPVGPEPVDPTWCPTCLSGLQPTEPAFEEAIEAKY